MCGSPTDAFWSMAAMYRRALDALGPPYADARQVLYLGAPGEQEIPARWRPWFERIEVRWTDAEHFRRAGDGAQGYELLRAANPAADLTIICDADTLLVDRFPQKFLERSIRRPAVAAVIAHKPPPLTSYPASGIPPIASHDELWDALSTHLLGRRLEPTVQYNLTRGTARDDWRCPSFYINHGFIATTPQLLRALADEIDALVPRVQEVLDNDFCDQIAVAYGVVRAGIPHRLLPVRFNFPNIPACDRLFPNELEKVIVVHYLNHRRFDRHRIFAEEEEFARFMELPLSGSDARFRDAVRTITEGRYPFSRTPARST